MLPRLAMGIAMSRPTGVEFHNQDPIAAKSGIALQQIFERAHEQAAIAWFRYSIFAAALLALQFRHALRNALIPVTTVAGLHLANLLSGAVVVEEAQVQGPGVQIDAGVESVF